MLRKIETGGARNEKSLTDEQIRSAIDYATSLGIATENIAYGDKYWTGHNASSDILLLGTDLYPKTQVPNGAQ